MINKYYLRKEIKKSIRDYLDSTKQRVVVLEDFLDDKFYTKIYNLSKMHDFDRLIIPDYKSINYSVAPQEFQLFINGELFKSFIKDVLNKEIDIYNIDLIKLGHQDYSILRDDNIDGKNKLIFELTLDWQEDFGGTTYLKCGEFLQKVFPKKNSLTIIDNTKISDFVKYINNRAKNNYRLFIIISFF